MRRILKTITMVIAVKIILVLIIRMVAIPISMQPYS